MKETNGKVSIFIVILLVIIIISGIILALKVTGIIKSKEREITQDVYTDYSLNQEKQNYSYLENDKYNDWQQEISRKKTTNFIWNIILIFSTIIINIGICKLYKKLNMPNYVVNFTFIYPFLLIIKGWTSGTIENILNITFTLFGIISMYNYFKALDMSGIWAILLFLAIFFLPIGYTSLILSGMMGSSNIIASFITVLSLAALIAWLVAYIKSSIKLGQLFNKSNSFIVGLVILPFIFQPILGYNKQEI